MFGGVDVRRRKSEKICMIKHTLNVFDFNELVLFKNKSFTDENVLSLSLFVIIFNLVLTNM